MAEPIRAKFLETPEHYLEAQDNNPRKSNFWVVAFGVVMLLSVLFSLQARLEIEKGDRHWWVSVVAGGFAALLALLFISPAGQRWQIRRRLRKELSDPPTTAWFEFGEDGFISTGQGGRTSFHPWPTIPKAVERKNGVVLYFDKDVYYWIPARAFERREGFDSFLQRVSDKVSNFKRLQCNE